MTPSLSSPGLAAGQHCLEPRRGLHSHGQGYDCSGTRQLLLGVGFARNKNSVGRCWVFGAAGLSQRRATARHGVAHRVARGTSLAHGIKLQAQCSYRTVPVAVWSLLLCNRQVSGFTIVSVCS